MALFVGSPLYSLYLRALGAKVGRGAVIFSRNVPVCTDLLSIGDGAVIRKDSFLTGYRAHDGVIQTGRCSVGKDALVGEATVLDIGTSLGDGAQLGHASSLHAGQAVPDGERWHGSPAQPTDVGLPAVARDDVGTLATGRLRDRAAGEPAAAGCAAGVRRRGPRCSRRSRSSPRCWTPDRRPSRAGRSTSTRWSSPPCSSSAPCSSASCSSAPFRALLNRFITPDKVYPLYGFHYWVHRAIARMTNSKFYMRLFGDTSYIVHYLRWLGYDLHDVRQTGSNFGEVVKHDNPFLSAVGSGTMVADGLSIINADFSSTSFRLSRVSIGAENFLGNRIAYPSQGRTGDNCLLATKVMVPLDGHGAGGRGPAGLAQLRDPADGQARPAARRGQPGRAAPRPPRQEHPQHRHAWRCSC